MNNRWLLPQGIEESLPQEAQQLEAMRRTLLDTYARWGYQLVMPPFIEYLDSLLTGTGHDLNLQTFQLVDQLTGRVMGVRADMTPQVARIDAHQLKREAPNRLCYIGTVLHTRPDGFGGSRSPMQVGAELYGHAGIESDVEIICLMLETFRQANVKNVFLDLGHVGIFRALAAQAGLNAEQEATLFEMLQRKAIPEIGEFLNGLTISGDLRNMLASLPELHGDETCIARAEQILKLADASVKSALEYLRRTAQRLRERDNVVMHFDLSELRGYHYQTGIVFAAYVPGQGQEIARGGRYDAIGEVFGRARAATGFSTDLKTLVDLSADELKNITTAIFAPCVHDSSLLQTMTQLRAQGETVIEQLPGQAGDAKTMGCDRQLIKRNAQWLVEKA